MERLFSISVKVVVSILFQKARKVLNNERGEANYFSTVVFIFIAVLLLAFIIDLFSIISTKQELDHAADQMVKQIQLSGGVNSETDELFEFLSSQIFSAGLFKPDAEDQSSPFWESQQTAIPGRRRPLPPVRRCLFLH